MLTQNGLMPVVPRKSFLLCLVNSRGYMFYHKFSDPGNVLGAFDDTDDQRFFAFQNKALQNVVKRYAPSLVDTNVIFYFPPYLGQARDATNFISMTFASLSEQISRTVANFNLDQYRALNPQMLAGVPPPVGPQPAAQQW